MQGGALVARARASGSWLHGRPAPCGLVIFCCSAAPAARPPRESRGGGSRGRAAGWVYCASGASTKIWLRRRNFDPFLHKCSASEGYSGLLQDVLCETQCFFDRQKCLAVFGSQWPRRETPDLGPNLATSCRTILPAEAAEMVQCAAEAVLREVAGTQPMASDFEARVAGRDWQFLRGRQQVRGRHCHRPSQ